MSVSNNKAVVNKGTRKGSSQPPSSKALRRDFSLVSPASPDLPISATSLRTMLHEALEPLSQELDGVRRSIQDNSTKLGDIKPLSKKCADLEAENTRLKSKLEITEARCQSMEEKLLSLETRSRRNNLKFIPMKNNKLDPALWQQRECDALVTDLCRKYGIYINPNQIEISHRLGKSKDAPVIAKFFTNKDKVKVLKEKQKFRSDGVIVAEDFPHEITRRRKIFSKILTAAYKMPGTYKAFLSHDKLILNGKAYSYSELDQLPTDIRPSSSATVTKDDITAFYSCHSKLSNHYCTKFTTKEGEFTSVEQYFMYQKAKYFGDSVTAAAIRQNDDPVAAKNLGKTIKNFEPAVWRDECEKFMRVALSAKFEQNAELAEFLKATGNSTLVEANPHDKYWGAGLSMADDVWSPSKWKGANKLGKMLEDLRRKLIAKI